MGGGCVVCILFNAARLCINSIWRCDMDDFILLVGSWGAFIMVVVDL